jgi:quercetin 2,3-dioxygenase
MITLRPSEERGHADHGWLNAKHTFSFADYYDPRHMGFRSLRVMNEDRIAPGMGFGTHPHADMEIVTLLLEGALRHKDSMGNEGVIGPGEIQYMSAGSGVKHSEFNDSKTAPAHLYQIWIVPTKKGLPPAYGQRDFSSIGTGKVIPLASPSGEEGAMPMRTNDTIYTAKFAGDETVFHPIGSGRYAWVQAVSGNLVLNGLHKLAAGDGAALAQESEITLTGDAGAQALIFDLA